MHRVITLSFEKLSTLLTGRNVPMTCVFTLHMESTLQLQVLVCLVITRIVDLPIDRNK